MQADCYQRLLLTTPPIACTLQRQPHHSFPGWELAPLTSLSHQRVLRANADKTSRCSWGLWGSGEILSRQIDLTVSMVYDRTIMRDIGVQADYVDRAFRKTEERLKESRTARTKARIEYGKRDDQKADVAALDAILAARPLKPPGKR